MLLSQVQRPLTSQDRRQAPEEQVTRTSSQRDILFEMWGVMSELTESDLSVYIIHICNQGCSLFCICSCFLFILVDMPLDMASSIFLLLQSLFFDFFFQLDFLGKLKKGCTQLLDLSLPVCVLSRLLWWLADTITLGGSYKSRNLSLLQIYL